VICWQYSVQKPKTKVDKFGAFGAAERQSVRFCPVRFTAVVKFTVCIPFCLTFFWIDGLQRNQLSINKIVGLGAPYESEEKSS